jgi:O-antigen ligase
MKAIQVGLCAVLAFAVLSYGAVEVWSQSIVEMAAAALFLIWALWMLRARDRRVEWNPLNWPFLALIAIGAGQLFLHATVSQFFTRAELLRLGAFFLLFFLFAQVFQGRAALAGVAWFLLVLSFLVSLFGIIQYFTSNGKIYWLQSLAIPSEFFGPYVNRNHFAGFVELTVPTGLALLVFRGVRRDLFPLTMLLSVVPLAALALTGSRAGVISTAAAILVLLLLARRGRAMNRASLAAVALVTLAAGGLIGWIGIGRTALRFSQVQAQELSTGRRASMLRGALHIFRDYRIRGSGLGTLVDVYPRYETQYDGRLIDHVHDDYAEALAETGILGGLCGAAFLILLALSARRMFAAEQGHFSRALHAGALAAVGGILIHTFVDFNLHIPANALLFLLQVHLATSPPIPSARQAAASRDARPA